jgi:2-hydroxy-3-keto-5-methylthiopentenyl-1-phosphate phosphatase
MMKYKFFCDFDGTITKEDVIDKILETFADPQWKDVEQSWIRGEIGSRDCLAQQTRLIRAREEELIDFVGQIEIDETFIDFVKNCRNNAVGVAILSDGVDRFIKSILHRYGLDNVKVFSNSLKTTDEGLEMLFPFSHPDCLSGNGICKCKVMEELSSPVSHNILVGDGRSDYCIALKAHLTFAKSGLLDFCKAKEIRHIEFNGFDEISQWLTDRMKQENTVSNWDIYYKSLRENTNGQG